MGKPTTSSGDLRSGLVEDKCDKSTYTCEDLFKDVAFLAGNEEKTNSLHLKTRSRIKVKNKNLGMNLENLNKTRVYKIWKIFCDCIEEQVKSKKGINVPQLGKFVRNQTNSRLAFVINDNFIRTYRIQHIKSPVVIPHTIVDLNYSMLSFKTKIPKDEIKFAVTEAVSCIGNAIAHAERPLMISFGEIGTMYADHRRVQFAFGFKNGKGRQSSGNAAFMKHAPESAMNLALNAGASAENSLVEEKEVEGKYDDTPDDEEFYTSETKEYNDLEIVPRLDLDFESKIEDKDFPESPMAPPPVDSHDLPVQTREVQPCFFNNKVNERNRPGPNQSLNMNKAFSHYQKQVSAEVDRLKKEDSEIEERAWRSEMHYKNRLLKNKKDQLEMNAFLIKQAKERQQREAAEIKSMKEAGIIVEDVPPDNIGKTKQTEIATAPVRQCKAFPMEGLADPRIEAKTKYKLKKALDEQVTKKKNESVQSRVDNVAEERFLLECNRKHMEDDRQRRLYFKYKERQSLKAEWGRQKKLQEMQRLLQDTKDGKTLSNHLSCDDILRIKSVSSSRTGRTSEKEDAF